MKHILVSVTFDKRLHWRLIAARSNGKHWEISPEAYQQFLKDIGYTNRYDGEFYRPRRDNRLSIG